ncbi:MAG TPA: DNA replication/repair protein RecF [Caulobacteraceae bacterium]|nr:DNA replication/repair protein RecF [Caulobacteraceae bacterium]
MKSALVSVALTDFRSYDHAELVMDGRPVFLFGPNGAGKTNLLEAISFFAPGRGLRGAGSAEVGRRSPGETRGRAWSVSARLQTAEGEARIGTGVEPDAARRTVRIEGETVQPGRLVEILRLVWLTPAQDRLFLEGGTGRRRFLDRLAYAAEPAHATAASAFEKAMRERTRLLSDPGPDPAWLDALEVQAARAGAALAAGRARTLEALQAEIEARADRPFPQARLSLSGDWGQPDDEARLQAVLARSRDRDAAAGRALSGPHRTDLVVIHAEKDRPAAECSTGEQKALILNLVLAQAARLSRAKSDPNPILLLDEVAAHLDARRRAALFDEITALGLQAFLTGTDQALFEDLADRALGVRVDASALFPIMG